jgi:hypothetical protein
VVSSGRLELESFAFLEAKWDQWDGFSASASFGLLQSPAIFSRSFPSFKIN